MDSKNKDLINDEFLNNIGYFSDQFITFQLDEKKLYIITENNERITIKTNSNISENISVYIYNFYKNGHFRGRLLDNEEEEEYLANSFQLVKISFSFSQCLIECKYIDKKSSRLADSVLITVSEVLTIDF